MDKLIGSIQKNSLEILRVSLNSFRGSEFLSLRYWFDSSGKGKTWLPSKKGISIPLPFLCKLSEMIKKAVEEAESWSRENENE